MTSGPGGGETSAGTGRSDAGSPACDVFLNESGATQLKKQTNAAIGTSLCQRVVAVQPGTLEPTDNHGKPTSPLKTSPVILYPPKSIESTFRNTLAR